MSDLIAIVNWNSLTAIFFLTVLEVYESDKKLKVLLYIYWLSCEEGSLFQQGSLLF